MFFLGTTETWQAPYVQWCALGNSGSAYKLQYNGQSKQNAKSIAEQQASWTQGSLSRMETMSGTENLACYPGLVRP